MALLTVIQVRESVQTGLNDSALQRVMDAVEQDIDQKHGAVATQEDDLIGGDKSLWTTRPILTITSVVETIGTTDTTLATDDYKRRHNTQLDRLNTGTNGSLAGPRWGCRVLINYVPIDTTDRRITVYLNLIQINLNYNGLDSSKDGDFSSKSVDYKIERERLLSGLNQTGGFA